MLKEKTFKLTLAFFSGILLGLAFPPVPTGITAIFAFVFYFILLENLTSYGNAVRYSYLTFLVFNVITLYWAGGYTHCKDIYMMIAGGLLLLAHPIFLLIPILVWFFIRRNLGFNFAIITFPFLWVGFEYFHSSTEIGFPWLLLGNTQTYDLSIIQFASITGVYGISFWILILNVLIFLLYKKISSNQWEYLSLKFIFSIAGIIIIYLLPKIYGNYVLQKDDFKDTSEINIAVIQPNIDPFEKWTIDPDVPLEIILQQTNEIKNHDVDLAILPETAIPFYILHPNNINHFKRLKNKVDSLNVNLIVGIPDIHYYSANEIVPKSSKTSIDGDRYDTYNSSILLQPFSDNLQKYAKIILVPFAERVPFSETLSFLNAMEWNFGLGGWGIGKDTTVFSFITRNGDTAKFSNMICYESVIPGFVSSFAKKGAQFLTIITNDSWWGNTSGAYQHKQYAVLRAIENRRWVVQCANGGISCIIDPLGRIHQQSKLYEKIIIFGKVGTRNELSFYTKYGNWFSEFIVIFCAIFITAVISKKFYLYIRKKNENGIH